MGELLPGVKDVGEEEGETAVVVQPVNINRVAQRILVQENSPLKWLKHDMDPCSHSTKKSSESDVHHLFATWFVCSSSRSCTRLFCLDLQNHFVNLFLQRFHLRSGVELTFKPESTESAITEVAFKAMSPRTVLTW